MRAHNLVILSMFTLLLVAPFVNSAVGYNINNAASTSYAKGFVSFYENQSFAVDALLLFILLYGIVEFGFSRLGTPGSEDQKGMFDFRGNGGEGHDYSQKMYIGISLIFSLSTAYAINRGLVGPFRNLFEMGPYILTALLVLAGLSLGLFLRDVVFKNSIQNIKTSDKAQAFLVTFFLYAISIGLFYMPYFYNFRPARNYEVLGIISGFISTFVVLGILAGIFAAFRYLNILKFTRHSSSNLQSTNDKEILNNPAVKHFTKETNNIAKDLPDVDKTTENVQNQQKAIGDVVKNFNAANQKLKENVDNVNKATGNTTEALDKTFVATKQTPGHPQFQQALMYIRKNFTQNYTNVKDSLSSQNRVKNLQAIMKQAKGLLRTVSKAYADTKDNSLKNLSDQIIDLVKSLRRTIDEENNLDKTVLELEKNNEQTLKKIKKLGHEKYFEDLLIKIDESLNKKNFTDYIRYSNQLQGDFKNYEEKVVKSALEDIGSAKRKIFEKLHLIFKASNDKKNNFFEIMKQYDQMNLIAQKTYAVFQKKYEELKDYPFAQDYEAELKSFNERVVEKTAVISKKALAKLYKEKKDELLLEIKQLNQKDVRYAGEKLKNIETRIKVLEEESPILFYIYRELTSLNELISNGFYLKLFEKDFKKNFNSQFQSSIYVPKAFKIEPFENVRKVLFEQKNLKKELNFDHLAPKGYEKGRESQELIASFLKSVDLNKYSKLIKDGKVDINIDEINQVLKILEKSPLTKEENFIPACLIGLPTYFKLSEVFPKLVYFLEKKYNQNFLGVENIELKEMFSNEFKKSLEDLTKLKFLVGKTNFKKFKKIADSLSKDKKDILLNEKTDEILYNLILLFSYNASLFK